MSYINNYLHCIWESILTNINGFYYLCCLAQESRYNNVTGAETTVYKVEENNLLKIIDIIFKNVI